MPFSLLADENVALGTAAELRSRGHDAIHVAAAGSVPGRGTPDGEIVEFATEDDRILITGDKGFLDPDHRNGVTVLFCLDDDLRPREIGALVDGLEALVAEQRDLPEVHYLRRADLE
jgi:predicted nuclease of predicted toxin-antitoxin system